MPFDPEKRQHTIETAEYRVDGDYSHAIPAHPEYNSATTFNNAFYQERRDKNDRLVGLPVLPIEYTDAPPAVEIPDPGLRFTLKTDFDTPGPGILAIGKWDISYPTSGNDLDGNPIVHHPDVPTSFTSSVTGQLILVYYDTSNVLRSTNLDVTWRNINTGNGTSFYSFPSSNRPDQEFLDSLNYGTDCWIDSSYP